MAEEGLLVVGRMKQLVGVARTNRAEVAVQIQWFEADRSLLGVARLAEQHQVVQTYRFVDLGSSQAQEHSDLMEAERQAVRCTAKGPAVTVGVDRKKQPVDQSAEARMRLQPKKKALVEVQSSEADQLVAK